MNEGMLVVFYVGMGVGVLLTLVFDLIVDCLL